jgi:DNA-directed RNA polymerase specialized sigma24 family protein
MNEVRMFFRNDRAVLSLDECPRMDSGPSPLARAEQMERLEWSKAGMDKLSDRDRATVRLRDFEGLSLTETVEVFESSEAATKSRHFRARKRLAGAVRSVRGARKVEWRRASGAVPTSRASQ